MGGELGFGIGQYRFRPERVYRRAAACTTEPLTAAVIPQAVGLGRNCIPGAASRTKVCSAICSPDCDSERPRCDNLHTTLVLEPDHADFSTEAGNSALIFKTKSPRSHATPVFACQPDGELKTRTFWLNTEGMHVTQKSVSPTIRSRYRTVIRRTDIGAFCSRRACGRQAHDGFLGSLGARRQQGLDRSGQ
jgi:hypothetical protein